MTVDHSELASMGHDVKFWKRKVAEFEASPDRYGAVGQEQLRHARQQLRQAQKALKAVKQNIQMRLF